jgi:hypothetical protein
MDYQPQLYNGTLPGPTGQVAMQLHAEEIAVHRQRAADLFTFFQDPTKNLLDLNSDSQPRTCIIGLPSSSKVRVLHTIGAGASGIGSVSPIDGQLLFLTGDGGNDIGTPVPLVLPPTILESNETICMELEQFKTLMTDQEGAFTWPLQRRSVAVNNPKRELLKIAPLPAFLVLDGLTNDVCAAELLERLLALDDTTGPMLSHLKYFLLGVLTGHNQGDCDPRVTMNMLFTPPHADARRWATSKFKDSYPALNPPPAANAGANAAPGGGGLHPDILALLAQLIPQPAAAANANEAEEEKKEDTIIGMPQLEYDTTLLQCGAPPNSLPAAIPEWFTLVSTKGMSKVYMGTVIGKHIRDNYKYDDAEVPLTNNIIKTMISRSWNGGESNINRPALLNATSGLTPFAVLDLTEDEVAAINDEDDALQAASHVTWEQMKAVKRKNIATVPETSEKFLRLLRRFGNWLFAGWSEQSPLFRCTSQIIKDLLAYSPAARDKLSMSTKASILWVLHKQCRQFAVGEMGIIAEFAEMQRTIAAKNASYNHAETPSELWQQKKKDQKRKDAPPTDTTKDNNKKQKDTTKIPQHFGTNKNTWHPKLREKLAGPLRTTNYPTFTAIKNYCNFDPDDILGATSKLCGPNAFFGRCNKGLNCLKMHNWPSDAQADKILEVTKKFQTAPEGILQGQ